MIQIRIEPSITLYEFTGLHNLTIMQHCKLRTMSCPFVHFFHMFIRTPTIFLDSRINETFKANLTICFIMLGANREHSIMCEPITCLVEWMAILDTDRTMCSKSEMYDYILIYISLHQSTDKCREMQTLVMVRLAHKTATIWISHIRSL